MTLRRSLLRATLAVPAAAALCTPALAQGLAGQRPIRLIVPYPPGGSTDVISRLYAERMSASLGQPVVVENRAGASGNLGTDTVAKAAPDGLTIGAVTASIMAINQFLFRSMPFDTEKDLVPIGWPGRRRTWPSSRQTRIRRRPWPSSSTGRRRSRTASPMAPPASARPPTSPAACCSAARG
ncbi:Bug family tripartite tricarboxylate transporter substrate binding protein [Teichococcus aestuarii]|uniref:Bug family tripartite tricarboxylate transporter substrate binding protein n=1 Tax=Teichococcus aestuarii TaxID=568898 RepID=UPI003623FDD7